MARRKPEQRTKPVGARESWCELRPQAEVRTEIVSVEGVWRFVRDLGAGDRAAAGVAARQLELIGTEQLYAAGLRKDAILTRRRRGTLHLIHRGVYLVGQPILVPGARELAAVLACRGRAVVSHRSAAGLWGFSSLLPEIVEVTVAGQSGRKHSGLCAHRAPVLSKSERRLRNGIPITSPARTLLDFGSQVGSGELERAIAEAYALGLTSEDELRKALARNPNRSGAAALRAELDREGGPAWTRSEGELRMNSLIREARLPPPLVNARVDGYEVDFYWPTHHVILEVDGYRFHGHRSAFENDRRKQTVLEAAGYHMLRITWRALEREPLMVAAALGAALRGGRARH